MFKYWCYQCLRQGWTFVHQWTSVYISTCLLCLNNKPWGNLQKTSVLNLCALSFKNYFLLVMCNCSNLPLCVNMCAARVGVDRKKNPTQTKQKGILQDMYVQLTNKYKFMGFCTMEYDIAVPMSLDFSLFELLVGCCFFPDMSF